MYFSIKWDEVSLLSTDNLTHLFDGLIYTQQRPRLMANYCVCTKNGIQQNLQWGNNFFCSCYLYFYMKYYVINMYAQILLNFSV